MDNTLKKAHFIITAINWRCFIYTYTSSSLSYALVNVHLSPIKKKLFLVPYIWC